MEDCHALIKKMSRISNYPLKNTERRKTQSGVTPVAHKTENLSMNKIEHMVAKITTEMHMDYATTYF